MKKNKIQQARSIDFEIHGGRKLSGSIRTGYSKNGSVGLLCASLLNRGTTILHGIAEIEEVYRVIEVLQSIGVHISWISKNTVQIMPPKKFTMNKINKESAEKTRAILLIIGPLLTVLPSFSVPHAQGCNLGKRTIAAHKYALEELGATIQVTGESYKISSKRLKPKEVIMYESGDTAVENTLLAAAKIEGKTVIKFASSNYMVQEICFFLEKCGVRVESIGNSRLVVHGIKDINKKIEYHNSEDPIESMTFIAAAIATDSKLTITHAPINFLELELYKLGKMGLKFKISKIYKSKNGRTNLVDVTIFPSKLTALDDKIHANPYPGINMDNLPYFAIPAMKASGETLIHDWTYENRAIYLTELNKMGAHLRLASPHRLFITGGQETSGKRAGLSAGSPAINGHHACNASCARHFNPSKRVYDQSWIRRHRQAPQFHRSRHKSYLMKPHVIVIIGQTATGKSALAVKIAKKFNGEIISADSRQVYRGLDIGTAKVTKKEMQGVPHHLIDVADPKRKFTVDRFKKLAESKIRDILKRKKLPIICGGTGFYIDAVANGIVFPEVPPNARLRKKFNEKSTEELFGILSKLDKRRAKTIDSQNKVRLIRAIEIAKHLGNVPALTEATPPYLFIKIGVILPLPTLEQRIRARTKKMLKAGLLQEIKKLRKAGITQKRLQEFGFEYDEPTEASVSIGTIKYAKRQMTWFKRDRDIAWFSPKDITPILKFIQSKIT